MGHIITLGGGGFLNGSEPELDAYLLHQSEVASPKIGYIGTASGDDTRFVVRFFARFSKLDCIPSALGLFGRVPDLEQWVHQQDVIFVGGGNTKSMLGVWQAWRLPELLKQYLAAGKVLSGVSAGAICWFESGITDSVGAHYSGLDGLGFLPGSCCPHYDSEPARVPVYERLVQNREIPPGIAIDDGVAVHWYNDEIQQVVSGRRGGAAYSVNLVDGEIVTRTLPNIQYLGATA